jgi:hypothetical protein
MLKVGLETFAIFLKIMIPTDLAFYDFEFACICQFLAKEVNTVEKKQVDSE